MLEVDILQALKIQLFFGQLATVFTILDGASVPDLTVNLASFNPEHICLYRGELEPDMAEVAPYLAILEHDAPFTQWVLSNGWGKHWGIFGVAHAELSTLRMHFRKFLTVYDEAGKSLYFRYYDPRVLRVYLPTCSPEELKIVFGPVNSYLVEDKDPKSCRKFIFVKNALQTRRLTLG